MIKEGAVIGAVLRDGLSIWLDRYSIATKLLPLGSFATNIVEHLRAANYPTLNDEGSSSRLETSLRRVFSELAVENNVSISSEMLLNHVKNILESELFIQEDSFWGAFVHQRALKTLTEIAVLNIRTNKIRCLLVEPTDLSIAKTLHNYIASHPQVQVHISLSFAKMPLGKSEHDRLEVDWSRGGRPFGKEEAFHIILLNCVLSKARHIPKYLHSIQQSLDKVGFLLVNEVTRGFARRAAIELLLGSAAGGECERHFGLYLDDVEWRRHFKEAGFVVIAAKADPAMDTTLFLLRRKPDTPLRPILVDCDDVVDFPWVPQLQDHIHRLQAEPLTQTIVATSTKIGDNGIIGLVNCFRAEYVSQNRVRGMADISLNPASPSLDLSSAEVAWRLATLDLHLQLYRDGVWGSICSIPVQRDVCTRRLTQHAFMNTIRHGDLSSFDWVESPNQFYAVRANRTKYDGLVAIYYSSINFRDIMLATGRLSSSAIPGDLSAQECVLGGEFAGRLVDGPDKGKRVFGVVYCQALATDVQVNRLSVFDVPDHWTMAEAATVCVVYTTAYYALVIRGRLKKSHKVLIHGGSGGVGQAAIAVALSYGAEVYTTVSTPEKKAFLQTRFPQLADRHFSDSRSTAFEAHIAEQTGGRGVDVVLNSLSEDKLFASVRCLATYGRFLEIGKFDLANNSQLGMEVFLKNAEFHGILIDPIYKNPDWTQMCALMMQGIDEGTVKPLPMTMFPRDGVEDAFRFMAQGKHIGKVVIQFRKEESSRICPPSPLEVSAIRRSYCDPEHGYLISGGLGGFGLELGDWLVHRGARHLTLTSRSGVRSGYQRRLISSWEDKGVNVYISNLDVSEKTQCRQLLNNMEKMRPIGGIFHLAVVLKDALFESQTVDHFKISAATKYWGTRNLDETSRSLCGTSLHWFVCFSSVSSGRGNVGQTNYGWANSAMERICERRHQSGLPGLAIQWGPIGDVGVFIATLGDNNSVFGGMTPQRMPSCLIQLDELMSWNTPVGSCFVRATAGVDGESEGRGNLLEAVARIIGVDVPSLDDDAPLIELGLDSLMGMELQQAVERHTDVILSVKEVGTLTLEKLKALGRGDGISDNVVNGKHPQNQIVTIIHPGIDTRTLLSHETIIPLNDVTKGPIVFFVHPIEGVGSPIAKLGTFLNCPAHCFQWTPEMPAKTIHSAAEFYIKAMKIVQPLGPYNIVGYSFGALIAFEMGVILESAGERATLTFIDGSHKHMHTYRRNFRAAYGVDSDSSAFGDPRSEMELLCALALRFAAVEHTVLWSRLAQASDWDDRVKATTGVVTAAESSVDSAVFDWVCRSIRARFIAADTYTHSAKLQCGVRLIRAEGNLSEDSALAQDYGLGEVVLGHVDVVTVAATHRGIVDESAELTAKLILHRIQ